MRWNKFKVECGLGCVNYSEVPRLELPEVRADEEVITYSGYSDICYGQEAAGFTKDPAKVAFTVSYDSDLKLPEVGGIFIDQGGDFRLCQARRQAVPSGHTRPF